MKIIQNEKIFGLNLREQHVINLTFLILLAIFGAVLWIVARSEYDSYTAMGGFGLMIISSIGAIGILLEKYDIPLGLSLLGIIPVGFIAVLSTFSLIFEPLVTFHPLFLVYIISFTLLFFSCLFSWNLGKQQRLQKHPKLRSVKKNKHDYYAAASIFLGAAGLFVVEEMVPVGLSLGIISIILGERVHRRNDKIGLVGIILGGIVVVYSVAWGIAYSAGLT